jgi:hypothetical protein
MQFVDLFTRHRQRILPGSGDSVDPSPPPACIFVLRLEQAAPFQPMQQRVQRSRPDPVTVMRQLLHHGQPKDRLMRGMHQHMNPNQAEKEIPLLSGHPFTIPLRGFSFARYRISI